jgi:hypothetical protein
LLGHAEIIAAVRDQFVGLLERAIVQQELDAFPRRHLPFFVLPFAALFAAALLGKAIAFLEFGQFVFVFHGAAIIAAGKHACRVREKNSAKGVARGKLGVAESEAGGLREVVP